MLGAEVGFDTDGGGGDGFVFGGPWHSIIVGTSTLLSQLFTLGAATMEDVLVLFGQTFASEATNSVCDFASQGSEVRGTHSGFASTGLNSRLPPCEAAGPTSEAKGTRFEVQTTAFEVASTACEAKASASKAATSAWSFKRSGLDYQT